MSIVEFEGLVVAYKPKEELHLHHGFLSLLPTLFIVPLFVNIFQNREIPATLLLDMRFRNEFSFSIETQVLVQSMVYIHFAWQGHPTNKLSKKSFEGYF